MDYEQKYKEALERARELKNKLEKSCSLATPTGIESIFPELGENEDERIRKTLREIIIDYDPNNEILIKEVGVSQKQFLTWLEKQREREWNTDEKDKITNLKTFIAKCKGFNRENIQKAFDMIDSLKPQPHWKPNVEQLTAFAVHLNKRGAFRDDLCMDFEHEAQSFIEMQNKKEL